MFRSLVLALAVPAGAIAAPFDVDRYEAEPPGPVNTWWVKTAEGALLVFDAQRTAADADAAIEAIEGTGLPVAAILLTHPHPDHFGGLGAFAEAFPDAALVAGAPTAAALDADAQGYVALAGEADPDLAPLPQIGTRLADGESLTLGGTVVEARQFGAGEAEASTVFLLPEGQIAVTGDIATMGLVPFYAEARTLAWAEALDRLEALLPTETQVLPGHGDPAPIAELAKWTRGHLAAMHEAVGAAIAPASEGGAEITDAERATIRDEVEGAYAAAVGVAGMPLDELWALNVEAIRRELIGGEPGFRPPR